METLVLQNIVKEYKEKKVLNNISLSITKPGVYLIAGPNGCGKTTLLETIIGLRKPNSGSIKIKKDNIAFLTQQNTLRKKCTVKEELELVKNIYDIKDVDLKDYLKNYHLEEYYRYKTQKLSGGTKRRTLLAMTLLANRDIVILDEPVSGLDTFSRNEIWNSITSYAKEKIVIVSDHYLNQAADYSDYIYLLSEGNIILEGRNEDIIRKINGSHTLKVKSGNEVKVEGELDSLHLSYQKKTSGTVDIYYLEKLSREQLLELETKRYTVAPITFEDVYFYFTEKLTREEI